MKKKLLFILVTVMTFALFAPNAFAAVKNETELRSAIANGDTTIELGANIEVTNSIIQISKSITIDGKGTYKIYGSNVRKLFEISTTTETIEVLFKDITLENTYAGGRCIDTRSGNIELTLNKATLVTTTAGDDHDQTLTIGGNSTSQNDIVVNMIDSSITSGPAGYGIITYNPVNLTLNNSTITGYGAIYMKASLGSKGSAGSVVTIKNNSKLVSNNIYKTEGQNDFGVIVLEDENIKVNIENSTIEVNSTDTAKSTPFLTQEDNKTLVTPNEITVTGASKIVANAENHENIYNTDISLGNNKVTIAEGVESTLEIKEEQLPEETKVYEVITPEGEIKYVVATEEEIVEKVTVYPFPSVKEFEEMLKIIEEDEQAPEDLKNAYAEVGKLIANKNIAMAYDIFYEGYIGENYVVGSDKTELEKAVEVVLEIPEDLKELPKGYTRIYSVIRLHYNMTDNKFEVEELDASDNGDGTVSFESDKFSTYVLTYTDVKEELPAKTGDINIIMLIGEIIIAIGGIIVSSKKRLENNI